MVYSGTMPSLEPTEAAPVGDYMGPSAEALARAHTALAVGALVRILRNPEAHKASEVVAASRTLLEYGHGKPVSSPPPAQVAGKKGAQRFVGTSDAELERIARGEAPSPPAATLPNAAAGSPRDDAPPQDDPLPFGLAPGQVTEATPRGARRVGRSKRSSSKSPFA